MKKIKEVLLIDDSRADNMFHQLVVAKTGLVETVIHAKNGKEALDMFISGASKAELVFLDINMPIMDGYEFLQELENQKEITPPKVVVMLTTSVLSEDLDKSKKFKLLSGYINKPLTTLEVENIISKYFG